MGAIQAITAAASRILTRKGSRGGGGGKTDGNAILAWDMYRTVPEVGAYAEWVSNTMSGATLFAARRGPDGEILDAGDNDRASVLVSSVAGGPDGQSVLLGGFGNQLAVTGDSWVVIVPDPESDDMADDKWYVLSTEEVKQKSGKLSVRIEGEEIEIPEYDPNVKQDPGTPIYFRVWKPAPFRHEMSTSPVIRSLVVLEELRLLNAAVAALARSRITGRGVLLVPTGTRFPTQPGQDPAEDSLLDTFIEVASTAIREPESAAATVPIVLEIPGDLIDGVKLLKFDSEFDAMAIQLRDEAIRRFATGADVPAEILLGLADASHWGAWAITAEALRTGAEPKLALICNALTTEWLRPILEAEGQVDASEWMVWYDTSGLRSSSNKGASALEAYRLGLIDGPAARRELGFTEADAPGAPGQTGTEAQVARRTSTSTERKALPVSETEAPPAEQTESVVAAWAARTVAMDAGRDDAGRGGAVLDNVSAASAVLDSFTAGTDAALAEAVDGLVWVALGAASRKMTLTPIVPRPDRAAARALVASGTVHLTHPATVQQVASYRLLDGCWARVPSVASRYGVDPLALTVALDEYVAALLVTGSPHEFDNVPRLLARMRVGAS